MIIPTYASAAVQRVFQRMGATQVAVPPLLGVVFSRDRAMQLDATLRSFYLHCQDAELITLVVLYKTTSQHHAAQYAQLAQAYTATGPIHFVEEQDFRQELLHLLAMYGAKDQAAQLLFLVDDNLFVRDFRLAEIRETLASHPAAMGFALRLGTNITYRYTVDKVQVVPTLTPLHGSICRFDWTTAQGSFNYPLEVSSSVFRMDEMTRLVEQLPFTNPNTLEAHLARRRAEFCAHRSTLLCYAQSVTFCNPINKVQTIYPNRAGTAPEYAPDQLAELFDQGYRIRVEAYTGFTPNACLQEVALVFERGLNTTPAASR